MFKLSLFVIIFLLLPKIELYKSFEMDNGNSYTVSGKINGYNNGWVYLSYGDKPKKGMRTDSTKIINGMFSFVGEIIGIQPVMLGLRDKDKNGDLLPSIGYRGFLILSPGNLHIDGVYDSRIPLNAYGTVAQDEYNLFRKKVIPLSNKLNKIIRDTYAVKKSDTKKLDSLNTIYPLVRNEIKEIVKLHIIQFPNSLVSAYIAQSELINTDSKTLKLLYEIFTSFVKESHYGKDLSKIIQTTEATSIGNIAPSFNIPNTLGKVVSLEKSMGKYTLIDFWASWCGPCRRENPNLIKAYDKYQNKGFTIISISMDTNKKSWLNAVTEDKLPWVQLSDLKGTLSEIGEKYGITTIPMNFLIDNEGKIISRNLKGTELINQLEKIL